MSRVYVYRCLCEMIIFLIVVWVVIDMICVGVAVCGVSVVIGCMLGCCVFWFCAYTQ